MSVKTLIPLTFQIFRKKKTSMLPHIIVYQKNSLMVDVKVNSPKVSAVLMLVGQKKMKSGLQNGRRRVAERRGGRKEKTKEL